MTSPLQTSLPLDTSSPSFFELHMADRLHRALAPAISHIIQGILAIDTAQSGAARVPRRLTRVLVEAGDEVQAAVIGGMQAHAIVNHDALLAERFYQVQRVTGSGKQLGRTDRAWALACEVGLPYLKQKLDKLHRRWTQHMRPTSRFAKLVVFLYPFLHAAYEGSALLSQWLYLVGISQYFSASQWFLRQTFSRGSSATGPQLAPTASGGRSDAARASSPWKWRLQLLLRVSLVAAVTGFKILQWWRQAGSTALPSSVSHIQPAPPKAPKPARDGVPLPLDDDLCPLCHRRKTNPAASCDGYTFCFPCLSTYVQKHGRCPITLLPCAESSIRRIYLD